jgi:hypothetical protein
MKKRRWIVGSGAGAEAVIMPSNRSLQSRQHRQSQGPLLDPGRQSEQSYKGSRNGTDHGDLICSLYVSSWSPGTVGSNCRKYANLDRRLRGAPRTGGAAAGASPRPCNLVKASLLGSSADCRRCVSSSTATRYRLRRRLNRPVGPHEWIPFANLLGVLQNFNAGQQFYVA